MRFLGLRESVGNKVRAMYKYHFVAKAVEHGTRQSKSVEFVVPWLMGCGSSTGQSVSSSNRRNQNWQNVRPEL